MENYCFECEHRDNCELADQINFCEDCRDCFDCNIKSCCEAGHDIECNNGFEPKSDFDDESEEDKMKPEDLAILLDGNVYMSETTERDRSLAKENGIVIVYGYSDDNMEFEGALREEIGCFNGGKAYVTKDEVSFNPNGGAEIKAVWHNKGDPCWTFETDIPHATFSIYDDGEVFCVGIVFSLDDLAEV